MRRFGGFLLLAALLHRSLHRRTGRVPPLEHWTRRPHQGSGESSIIEQAQGCVRRQGCRRLQGRTSAWNPPRIRWPQLCGFPRTCTRPLCHLV